jgi:hypothetical protein
VISYTIFSFYLALDMRKIYSENYITIRWNRENLPKTCLEAFSRSFHNLTEKEFS